MGEKLGFGTVFSMFYPLQIPSTGVMGSGTSSAEPPTVAALGGTGFTVSPQELHERLQNVSVWPQRSRLQCDLCETPWL